MTWADCEVRRLSKGGRNRVAAERTDDGAAGTRVSLMVVIGIAGYDEDRRLCPF